MPFKSIQQAKLMYAAANGYTDKVPKKVAEEYIKASKGIKFKNLREKIKKKKYE